MADRKTEILRCPLFEEMSPEERNTVIDLMEFESYPEGETILRQGNRTRALWFVVGGQCEVAKVRQDSSETRIAALDPGAVFGEMSFFSPAPHSASIRAITAVEVARLSRSNYDGLEQTAPQAAHKIALSIVKILAVRLRRMDEWMYDLVNKPGAVAHHEEWREFRSKLYANWDF